MYLVMGRRGFELRKKIFHLSNATARRILKQMVWDSKNEAGEFQKDYYKFWWSVSRSIKHALYIQSMNVSLDKLHFFQFSLFLISIKGIQKYTTMFKR